MKIKSLLKQGLPVAIIIAGSMAFSNQAFAQLKVGDNPLIIEPSAALEVESTTKGIRYPRVALQSTDSFQPLGSTHIKGMTVYNTAVAGTGETSVVEGIYVNNGSLWQLVDAGFSPELTGTENPPSASLCITNGAIYTFIPDDEDNVDFGKQWVCNNGAWTVLPDDAPTKQTSPFWAGIARTGRRDVGANKKAPMWRGGPIKLQYEKTPGAPNTFGSTYLSSNGSIQLYRGTSSASNPFISFTNNIGNAQKMGIYLRPGATVADESFLAIQSRLTSTDTPYTTMLIGSNGNVNVNGNITLQSTIASGSRILSVGADGTGNINTGQGTKDGVAATYLTSDGSNLSIQNSGTNGNLFLTKTAGSGSDAVFINFRVNGNNLGHIMRDGADTKVRFVGNVTGVATPPSDRRLKENIKDTHYSVADLMKIEVKDYNFKEDKRAETGFIAQDLYKILPYAVHVGGADVKTNPWAVNYAGLTPVLVKAIQEQQREITSLKAQLEEMKALKAEVASIKSMLGRAEAAKDQPAK